MITRPPYKEALGIATGDIVSTSCGAGPYEVWSIWGPRYWIKNISSVVIWPWPIISLALFWVGYPPTRKGHHFSYLNNIHREGDCWFDDMGKEIFVGKPDKPNYIQAGLFVVQCLPEPYQFQPEVDYFAGDHYIFHCPGCGKDFNGIKDGYCIHHDCGTSRVALSIIMMGNHDGNRRSAYVRSLNA